MEQEPEARERSDLERGSAHGQPNSSPAPPLDTKYVEQAVSSFGSKSDRKIKVRFIDISWKDGAVSASDSHLSARYIDHLVSSAPLEGARLILAGTTETDTYFQKDFSDYDGEPFESSQVLREFKRRDLSFKRNMDNLGFADEDVYTYRQLLHLWCLEQFCALEVLSAPGIVDATSYA